MKVLHLKSIDSTHLYALRLISYSFDYIDTSDTLVIFADEQTNGIGRCNRSWVSMKGNLFTSIIVPMPKNLDLGQISLAVACAIRETIATVIEEGIKNLGGDADSLQRLRLHWPNDVYYNSQKISGLLLAVSNDMLIISVGINLNSSPSLSSYPTTNLREVLQNLGDCDRHLQQSSYSPSFCKFLMDYDRNQSQDWGLSDQRGRSLGESRDCRSTLLSALDCRSILDVLLDNISDWMYRLRIRGFSDVRSYWLRNIKEINCNVTVKNGNSVLNGIFLNIDDSGKAVLQQDDRRLLVSSGDLFINKNER